MIGFRKTVAGAGPRVSIGRSTPSYEGYYITFVTTGASISARRVPTDRGVLGLGRLRDLRPALCGAVIVARTAQLG